MSLHRLGWAAHDPARDHYTVTIAPPQSGTFLNPSPSFKHSGNLLDAHYGGEGGIILSAWVVSRYRGRASAGSTGMNPRRPSPTEPSSFFRRSFFCFSSSPFLHGPRLRPSVPVLIDRLTPTSETLIYLISPKMRVLNLLLQSILSCGSESIDNFLLTRVRDYLC